MLESTIWLFGMCLLLGSVVGVMAGLLGIGGGLLVVPALLWLLPQANVAHDIVMQIALATSLASIVLTSGSSAFNHFKLGNVDFYLIKGLVPGVVLGGIAGSYIAELIPSHLLPKIFSVIVLMLAVQMFISIRVKSTRQMPGLLGCSISGGIIGTVASLAGIGGGSLTVPYLSMHGVEMRKAIGSASLCGTMIAIAGMVGFVFHGLSVEHLPEFSVGYVYLPALIGIASTSVLTTKIGASLAFKLPTRTLKKVFAAFLICIGIKMFIG
jgi:uncharacterized membrane protein YfcA